ncbi:MAG: GTPase ObgE [Anaerolineales bacterium]|jgi:GTP-binding protein|nr:GTPase ObgE [Anaerolineales bacterium]
MFIDQAEIFVKSGKGGNGMMHFRREKYVPRGGPDGGDGGRGGDVIIEARHTVNSLIAFRHTMRFEAKDGKGGGSQKMYGRSAEDLIVPVPMGTVVYEAGSGDLLADLTENGQRYLVCKGGRGGRGNVHFKSAHNQVPTTAEKGEPGEEKRLRLELKLIADIGIIGVPNAGKSTLLSVLTNAKPEIAPYPFTTIQPNLGVAEIDEDTSVVLADIPGLIEGASQGIGLGHDFLRHIQRTRVLIHLLDGLSEDPLADFSQINTELSLFDENLGKKPQIVAFNKIDQPEALARLPILKKELKKRGIDLVSVSAMARTDVQKLLLKAFQTLAEMPAMDEMTPASMPVYRPQEDPNEFTITREDGKQWRVSGPAIERAAAMTYWEHSGSVRRFQRIIEAIGIEKALRNAGVQEGDTVFISEFELEWQD